MLKPFRVNLDFRKLTKLKNNLDACTCTYAILKQIYTLKLFIVSKGGTLNPKFCPKSFLTSTTGAQTRPNYLGILFLPDFGSDKFESEDVDDLDDGDEAEA